MGHKRVRHTPDFKAKVALEAIKGQKTINEIASLYGIHPNQIVRWKKQATDEMSVLFSGSSSRKERAEEELRSRLYQEIGQLKVEVDWLKKKCHLA
jgi:putative transposase